MNNKNGLLVEKDPKQIAETIINLMQNREKLTRIKKECKESSLQLNKEALNLFEKLVK